MSLVKFYKVTALPGELEADAFYFVENNTYAESYITNATGVARSVGNTAMINALIAAALGEYTPGSKLEIVADIAARDTLIATLDHAQMILVLDASDDSTVTAGSALYAYDGTAQVYKVAEYESMDVTLTWSSISGRPTATPAAIDAAVTASHTHSNLTVLNALADDEGTLTYNGAPVGGAAGDPEWVETQW